MRGILRIVAGGVLMLSSGFAQTQTPPPPGSTAAEREHYKDRREHQEDRIQQGKQNGDLTRAQAHRLWSNDKAIHREARTMAAKNGGQLSERQEEKIHHQMNRNSRAIYRANHR